MPPAISDQFAIPGAVAMTAGVNGFPTCVLTHAGSARATITLHGAHVTAWTDASGYENLYMSRQAVFASDTAIRGGIPVIFPQFGGRGPLAAHGFARTSVWDLVGTDLREDGCVTATFALTDSAATRAIWPYRFRCALTVELTANTLTVALVVSNTDAQPWAFTTALHTYFAVRDIRQTTLEGLQGVTYEDALQQHALTVEAHAALSIAEEVDRVYLHAPDLLHVQDAQAQRTLTIAKREMPDVVVWNPWVEKSQRLRDFGDEDYRSMLCVETGCIRDAVMLAPGEHWRGKTTYISCAR